MTQTDKMLSRKEGGVGIVTFNNPERHNAVSLEMWEATTEILNGFAADNDIRVVVLTGAGGKAFVSGADISKFGSERATIEAVRSYNKKTDATSAGVADFRADHRHDRRVLHRQRRAWDWPVPRPPASLRPIRLCRAKVQASAWVGDPRWQGLLCDIVGPSFAKEIFYTARQFDAEEARIMRLVNRVVPSAELETYVKSITDMISANAPLTIKAVKVTVGEVVKENSNRNLARSAELVEACFASRDYTEGRTAFMEKRKPVFTGS